MCCPLPAARTGLVTQNTDSRVAVSISGAFQAKMDPDASAYRWCALRALGIRTPL